MTPPRLPILLACLLLLSAACLLLPAQTQPASARPDTRSILAALGGVPCPDSDFTCVTLSVPLDHRHPDDGRTLEVTFAVLPASGERKGLFVTATGGPGTSGLALADDYAAALDASILAHFDLVFFDQRGAGAAGVRCPSSAAEYYRTEIDPWSSAGEMRMVAAARDFVAACTAEMGRTDWLPYLGTDQAVEDLERFRQAMGDEQFWLYGESYGTQFAQTYAAAHPQRLRGLILDGPVDLTLSATEYLAEQAAAFNDVLLMTLAACNDDPACLADMGGEAVAVYDGLAARLREAPVAYEFPSPSSDPGGIWRRFTHTDLETAASGALYAEADRMILLRALAAASARDDFVPLARLLYHALSLDPLTELPLPKPTFSDALYYSVECNDYDFASPDEYLRAGDAVEASLPRFVSTFYGDLPCAFWPADEEAAGRPAPLVAEGLPTLVLVATADPATPPANAERIVSRLADGYLVVQEGGPHVIFGWGNRCVDGLVTDFLVRDALPARQTTCPGIVVTAYVPLAPADASAFADPLVALAAADDEIFYLPEYYYWDLETETAVGCPYGGSLTFGPGDLGEAWTFDGCAFSRGFALTGSAVYDYGRGTLTFEVAVTGLAEGRLVYVHDLRGGLRTVTGVYKGREIELSR